MSQKFYLDYSVLQYYDTKLKAYVANNYAAKNDDCIYLIASEGIKDVMFNSYVNIGTFATIKASSKYIIINIRNNNLYTVVVSPIIDMTYLDSSYSINFNYRSEQDDWFSFKVYKSGSYLRLEGYQFPDDFDIAYVDIYGIKQQ